MGNKTLIYKEKLKNNLAESKKHLKRVKDAFSQLQKSFKIPIEQEAYLALSQDLQTLAFCDQIIYRYSKLQDTMGAKLFKTFLLFQGENIDKPFLDILSELEKMNIIDVEEWFEMRDLRNEIAHEYGDDIQNNPSILNQIYKSIGKFEEVLSKIEKTLEKWK